MANSKSVQGTMILNTKGGYSGNIFIKSLELQPTGTAGIYTIKDGSGGAIIYEGANHTTETVSVKLNRWFKGIYLDDTIPSGGEVVVILG